MDKTEMVKLNKEIESIKEILERICDRVKALENPKIYNYPDNDMPGWARATVEDLMEKEILMENEKGELSLDTDMLRILVMLKRTGIFG